jgi:hypothetical protein
MTDWVTISALATAVIAELVCANVPSRRSVDD